MRKFSINTPLALFGVGLILAIAMSTPGTASAQALYGSISGNVFDATGAAIPGAEVTIVNVDTNYRQTTITGDAGGYMLSNVPDGVYRLTVSLTGFKEHVSENVTVTAGTVNRQNLTLQVGEISDTITVSSAATVLKTDTTDVSAQLETKEVVDLPLGAYRSYQTLINLVPGATPGVFQNAVTDTPGRSLSSNVNGTARNSNTARIDGAVSVNIWLPHHQAYVPPAETVEVVNISTNNFDAEQGFAGGAAITVLTKSGTNELHGSGFWLHENSALGARDYFREGDNPKKLRNIFGGTIGGPIVKDKLFFFGGFEGTLERLAVFYDTLLPNDKMRRGDFSDFLPTSLGGNCTADCTVIYDPLTGDSLGNDRVAFPGNVIPQNRLDPAAVTLASLLPPLSFPDRLTTNNYQTTGGQDFDRYNTDIKFDWYRSDTHRIWGKWSWMDAEVAKETFLGPAGGGATGGGGDGVGLTDVKVWGFGHNWTLSPTFLIDGNFGFTDMDQEVLTSDLDLGNYGQDVLEIPGTNATDSQSCPEGRCGGIPAFFTDYAGDGIGQVDGWSPLFRNEDSYTFTHNFSWTKSNHELRFGYDLVHHLLDHWQPEIGSGPRGSFSFSSNTASCRGTDPDRSDGISPNPLCGTNPGQIEPNSWAALMLGFPSSTGKSLQWELMTAREWQHAWYVRDRWQVTPNLTLTLGLRYEYYPLVKRADRKMEYLDLDSFEIVLDNNIKVSKTLFAPRLGFAYRMGDNNVVRAGYGITYSPLPFARPLRGFYPLTVAGDFSASDDFVPFRSLSTNVLGSGNVGIPVFQGPDIGPGERAPLPDFVFQRTMPPDKITRGYIQSWNVFYERKLPADFVASIGYVGTQTTNQLADHNLNWAPPSADSTVNRQLYPLSTTSIWFWDGWLSKNYHSLQVAVNRRFTRGLFVKAAYTYSKAIDMANDEGWQGISWNDPAIISRNRAQANYNRPQMLQIGTIYALPWGQGDGVGNWLIRDWQLNGIFSVTENTPFGIGTSSNLNTEGNSNTGNQVKAEVAKLGGTGPRQKYYDPTAFAVNTKDPTVAPTDPDYCVNLDCYGTTGRNVLRGPTWVNLDFSVFRTFEFTETTGLEFRAEMFNFANNPKFSNPDGDASSSTFMEIDGTNSNYPQRVIRFGLKLFF